MRWFIELLVLAFFGLIAYSTHSWLYMTAYALLRFIYLMLFDLQRSVNDDEFFDDFDF